MLNENVDSASADGREISTPMVSPFTTGDHRTSAAAAARENDRPDSALPAPAAASSTSATRPHTYRRQCDVSRPGPTSRAAYARFSGAGPVSTLPRLHSIEEARLWYRHITRPETPWRVAPEDPAMNRPAPIPATVDYPCSDGRPMAESGFQIKPSASMRFTVHCRPTSSTRTAGLRRRRHVSCTSRKATPASVVAPDVFVVIGAANHTRMSYKLWEEPKAPDFVLEITSRSTRAEDQGRKREVYASLGVREYWLFDPTGDWLAPPLQGFRLHRGEYRPLPSLALVHGGLSLRSEALGLDVRQDEDGRLRFHDPESGEDLPAHEEMRERVEQEVAARRSAEARLDEEAAAHRAARARLEEAVAERDARIAELEARLGPAR